MKHRLPAVLNSSLSLRLLMFASVMILLALALAWLVLGLLFERHSERQLQWDLERHGTVLIAALELGTDGRLRLERQPADPRFDRPASGLYWRIATPGYELRSRSLWDGALPEAGSDASNGWQVTNGKGAFEDEVLTVERRVQLTTSGPLVRVVVAADRQPVTSARAAFGKESAIFLGILWIALALAAWVQVRLGLKPLNRVRQQLEAMSSGQHASLPEQEHPHEIRPLTSAINVFARKRANDVDRARRRARDLAHAFKTPITALRLQIDTLEPGKARDMSHSLSLITGAVESELARSEGMERDQEMEAAPAIDRLLAVIAKTPDGRKLMFQNEIEAGLRIPMSMTAGLEVLGALIENAARHANTLVRLAGGTTDGAIWIAISDDGLGIADALRASVLDRGVRLDERGAGHGLGLSIVQDLVSASGGSVTLDRASEGGLCVRLDWAPSDVVD